MIKGVRQAHITQTGLTVEAIKQSWEFQVERPYETRGGGGASAPTLLAVITLNCGKFCT